MLPESSPNAIGFDPEQIARVDSYLGELVEGGAIPAASYVVGRRGRVIEPRAFGRQGLAKGSPPLQPDAIFLIASPTKPITAMCVMLLVQSGQVCLDDPVVNYLPAFLGRDRSTVTIRNLLTHTSGLPDQLPENERFRAEHSPLSRFAEQTYQTPLLFRPGTQVRYQSMGLCLLGELVAKVSGISLPEFMCVHLFEPLGLEDCSLGAPESWWQGPHPKVNRIPEIRVPEHLQGKDWNWNSRYWRNLGAPWGGMLCSTGAYAMICQWILDIMKGDGPVLTATSGEFGFSKTTRPNQQPRPGLSRAAIKAMTTNQLESLPEVPEDARRCRPWGLGWRLNWQGHSANFGDLLGPRTFGHWGATGTLVWIDPDAEAFLVLFTTQPQEPDGKYLARVSNMVAAALK